ncbi:MAG: arsenite methyltransferase [Anaerolineae bacterium]|nr:arsenite methyltransferase [Candidatus Roseilinea sp.]MDW8449004.1 arsenite methyltransferase [Anaerolineae bacterium]
MNNPIPITDIHASVRAFYAERAKNGDGCCAPSADSYARCGAQSANPFHAAELLDGIPEDVAAFTLGCGDAVSLARLRPGETVIDLGSGGGLECFIAAKQVGEAGRVIGVDMTPEMLSKAWANAARLKTTNVEFRYGFLEALPVADEVADVIISNCVINLSPDKPQVFREMFRILKPGGRIAVSDVVADGELSDEARRDMALWGACYSGALDRHLYAQQLHEAGFVDVKIEPKGGAAKDVPMLKGKLFSAAITAVKPPIAARDG